MTGWTDKPTETAKAQFAMDTGCGRAVDLITGREHDFGGGSELPPYSVFFWKCE